MSRWEHRYLGQERYPDALSAIEVEHFFTLGEEEFAAVRRRRRVLNRLALALQIGFLKMTGGTLNSVEIPNHAVAEALQRFGRSRCIQNVPSHVHRCSHSMQVGWKHPGAGG